ncbi:transmembrane protein 161B-like isoform X1 [Watersipora subatra]|uniref:transmembrane protein 161B-like isoform X1 n=1 Tax=Watersipora subatra TaxID=2589382 RepID=UPI00355AD183
MAVFGAQVVVTLISLSFLQKLCPIYSLGRWLLTKQNLVRYLHPSNEELRRLSAGAGKRNQNGKRGSKSNKESQDAESFSVSRSIELRLSSSPLSSLDVLPLRFYTEFIWLMDFTITTILVVAASYIHEHYISPQADEYGLSSLWCLLLICFSVRPLLSIVTSYRITENSGEIVLCCIFAFFFLVSAMIFLIIDDKTLEFQIVSAHQQFVTSANEFLSKRGLSMIGEGSLVTFRASLAILSSFVGSLLTFPGLRIAKCHLDSLTIMQERPLMQAMMYIEFLFPLFLLSLWIPPISRNTLIGKTIPGTAIEISNFHFDIYRDLAVVVFLLWRMGMLRVRLQAYLNTACTKLDAIRKEAGKITNTELQSSVTQIFYYLCVVAIQLVGPVTLIAGTLMMARSFTSAETLSSASNPSSIVGDSENLVGTLQEQVQGFTATLTELRRVFSSHLLQSVTSYCIWFLLYAWTATSYFGVFHHTYLVRT